MLWAAPSCSGRAGDSAQRRGLVSQVVQKLNPAEDCGLTVASLFSAAKSYLEGKKSTKKLPLPCMASLCDCFFPIDLSVCPYAIYTFYCSCHKLSLEYQYLIFNIYCPFSQ